MNFNKILGYSLLVLGLLLIIFVVYQSYSIFIKNVLPPSLFQSEVSLQTTKTGQANALQDFQKQLNDEVSKQIGQLIPKDDLYKLFNLVSWSVLAIIFIFGGGQIANLGIKLIKS